MPYSGTTTIPFWQSIHHGGYQTHQHINILLIPIWRKTYSVNESLNESFHVNLTGKLIVVIVETNLFPLLPLFLHFTSRFYCFFFAYEVHHWNSNFNLFSSHYKNILFFTIWSSSLKLKFQWLYDNPNTKFQLSMENVFEKFIMKASPQK